MNEHTTENHAGAKDDMKHTCLSDENNTGYMPVFFTGLAMAKVQSTGKIGTFKGKR